MTVADSIRHRFWPKVQVGDADACWPWVGTVSGEGYGRFRIGERKEEAHRVSYLIEHGPIPERLCVLHTCDNRRCVNPSHLWLGTKADNQRDCIEKGRKPRHRLKLNTEKAREIRETPRGRGVVAVLAAQYGVSKRNIRDVLRRKIWARA